MSIAKQVKIACCGLALFCSPAVTKAQVKKTNAPIVLSDIIIKGDIPKPRAFYILNRAPINYKSLNRRTNFIHKIIRATRHNPF